MICFLYCTLCANMWICLSLGIWIKPEALSLEFFLPKEYCFGIVRTAVWMVQSYSLLTLMAGPMIVGCLGLIYLYYIANILIRELPLGLPKYSTNDILRQPYHIRLVYRSMQICNSQVMGVFGFVFLFGQVSFSVSPMYINFILIRYWDNLHISLCMFFFLWLLFCLSFWSVILQIGGYLFVKGRKTISTWKRFQGWKSKEEEREMKKFAKSCTPIVICFGKQYVVKKFTLLKYHKGVGRGILRALLATKK